MYLNQPDKSLKAQSDNNRETTTTKTTFTVTLLYL